MTPALLQRKRTGGSGTLLTGSMIFLARYETDPLELEARQRIYDRLLDYPGLHLSEIAREMEMDTNHAKYHLRVLEDNGFVSSQREDGYWRFYPREDASIGKKEILQPEEKEWLSLLRRKVPLRMALLLLEHGPLPAGELGDALDVAPSTLHYHASKMEEARLLDSRKEGRRRVYELADPERVEELIARHEPPDALVEGFLEAWEEVEFP